MKRGNGIIAFLVIIIVILGVLVILLGTGKITFKADFNITNLNKDELKKIGDGDQKIIKQVLTESSSINLTVDGIINFNYNKEIANIENAINIELLNNKLYILTTKGEVYKYDLSNYKKDNLKADKMDDYKNVRTLLKYTTRGNNAGGCDYIVVIDKDNKYNKIDDFCI